MDFSSEKETEGNIVNVSVIAAGILIAAAAIFGHFVSAQAGLLIFVIAIIAASLPISIYEYVKYNKFRKMEEHFPRFLEDFSEAKKGGMMFPQAFQSISKTEYGSLSGEIKKSAAQLTWHIPFPKVMKQLSLRLGGSRLMKQAFTIINEAYNSGGDVVETMSSLAINVNKIKQIEDDRRGIMAQQVFVMYVIFFLFLGILVGLYQILIPMASMNAVPGAATGSSPMPQIKGFSSFGQAVNYCGEMPAICNMGASIGFSENGIYFKTLFFLMAVVQAICTGIIAGQVGEGTIVAGVRHIGILLFVTVIAFLIFFA